MKQIPMLDNAEQASHSVLSLPIEPLQNKEETMHVVHLIKEFLTDGSK